MFREGCGSCEQIHSRPPETRPMKMGIDCNGFASGKHGLHILLLVSCILNCPFEIIIQLYSQLLNRRTEHNRPKLGFSEMLTTCFWLEPSSTCRVFQCVVSWWSGARGRCRSVKECPVQLVIDALDVTPSTRCVGLEVTVVADWNSRYCFR